MAQRTFSLRLNAASFPFCSSFMRRTVVSGDLDNVTPAKESTGTTDSRDVILPQLYYCHNVIPTGEGISSVGYEEKIVGLPGITDFDKLITLRDAEENNFLFVPARGKNYIYTADSTTWTSTDPITGWTGSFVTHAYVNGRTFICYEGLGVFEYDNGTGDFTQLTLAGIDDTTILGITGASNYLIAWTNVEIHWSSLVDPIDFEPSLQTGAGFQIPQDVKGRIIGCFPTSGGFIIYTTKNAVGAQFTNSTRSPFIFREVANAGGIAAPEHVTSDSALGYQFAWTTGGLQKISVQSAETVFPEATDFLGGNIFEDFTAGTLVVTRLVSLLSVKITYLSSRYLIISYGQALDLFTHALVYDTALKRWGKLRVSHVDCFQYPYPNTTTGILNYIDLPGDNYTDMTWESYADIDGAETSLVTPPRRGIAFITSNGTVSLAVLDYSDRLDDAVAILGRYQLRRSRLITMHSIEVERAVDSRFLALKVLLSFDGMNTANQVTPTLVEDTGEYKRYGLRSTAKNMALLFDGTFELSSVVTTASEHGSR